jgi:hypothetical protein
MITPDDLAVLREDCLRGPKRHVYGEIKRYSANKLPPAGHTTQSPIQLSGFAFIYLIEGDERFGRAAADGLMAMARAGRWRADQGDYIFLPLAYDHVYPLLAEAQIDSLSRVVREHVKPGHLAKAPFYNLEANAAAACVLNGLAFYGDGAADDDEHFRRLFTDGFDRMVGRGRYDAATGSSENRGGVLPTRLRYAGDGGYHKDRGYTGKDLGSLVHFAEAVRTSGLFDAYDFAGDYFRNVPRYFAWMTRPDGLGLRQTTGLGYRELTARGYEGLAGIARRFHDGRASWLISSERIGGGMPPRWEAVPYCILWDPRVPPDPPSLERDGRYHLFGNDGPHVPGTAAAERFIYRSGWDISTGSRDFVFHLDASDYLGDNLYWNAGGFEVFYRGALAIKSGLYDERVPHYGAYSTQTVAANCILIWDEKQAELNARIGQDDLYHDVGRPEGIEDPVNGSVYDRGGIDSVRVRRVDGDEWVLVSASFRGEALYPRTRKGGRWVRRAIVKDKLAVIYDRVASDGRSRPMAWLLHTIEEPRVDGGIHAVDVAEHVTWHTDHTFHVARTIPDERFPNGGTLHGKRLLPEMATTRKVGGDGYEFWVDHAYPRPGVPARGENFPVREPEAIYDSHEGGAWRIEIYPHDPKPVQEFMVSLETNDGEAMTPIDPALDAETAGFIYQGTMIGFSRRDEPPRDPSYRLQGDANEILLFDLAPNAAYQIRVEGGRVASAGGAAASDAMQEPIVAADAAGTLRLAGTFPAGTRLALRRAPEPNARAALAARAVRAP